jgi:tetratricopeptide (TPR) repeat protein
MKHTGAGHWGHQHLVTPAQQERIAAIRGILEQDVMRARRMAEEALAEDPDSIELRETLVFTYIRVNDMKGVIELCAAVPAEKSSATLFEARGIAHLQLGENAAAFEAFGAASKIRPLALVADRMARALHRLGRVPEAIGILKSIIDQLGPNEALRFGAMRQMVYALRDLRRWTEADEAVRTLYAAYREQPIAVASAIASADMEVPYRGWMLFLNKGSLAHVLDNWHAGHSDQPRFWPDSFVVPGDEDRLARFKAAAPPSTIFAIKPENLYGGQGIHLTRDPLAHTGQAAVIQRYLDNPYLLDGKKFHARVYVLVTGSNPPRAYVYREGIARLAPERYATDDAALARPAIHVTNTALHLNHPDLRVSKDANEENVGNIWSMSAVYRQMAADGMDAQAISSRIAQLARYVVIIANDAGIFARQAAEHTRYSFPPRVFGLDVLVDASGRPWLIEYQRNPALAGSALVNRINADLCRTILGMTAYPLTDALGGRPVESLNDNGFRNSIEEEYERRARGLFERIL